MWKFQVLLGNEESRLGLGPDIILITEYRLSFSIFLKAKKKKKTT